MVARTMSLLFIITESKGMIYYFFKQFFLYIKLKDDKSKRTTEESL